MQKVIHSAINARAIRYAINAKAIHYAIYSNAMRFVIDSYGIRWAIDEGEIRSTIRAKQAVQRCRQSCDANPPIEISWAINATVIVCVSNADVFVILRCNPYKRNYLSNRCKRNQSQGNQTSNQWTCEQLCCPSNCNQLCKQWKYVVCCYAILTSEVNWAVNANAN